MRRGTERYISMEIAREADMERDGESHESHGDRDTLVFLHTEK